MRKIKTLASALVLALVVVASLDYTASAATGHSFILGKLNKANRVTALKRTTAGPALQLSTTSSNEAPLAVNGTGKVTNLNADLLDGRDATTFATNSPVRIFEFTAGTAATAHTFTMGGLPAGRYLATYSVGLYNSGATSGIPTVWGACHFEQLSGGMYAVRIPTTGTSVWTAFGAPDIQLSGSGPIDTADGDTLSLVCSAGKTWTTRPFSLPVKAVPATVTLTRIESPVVTAGTGS
jgi:hypothetical protein